MPAKNFNIARRADKNFLRLPRKIQAKIIDGYKKLKDNPIAGEKLQGELADRYKLRVGDYRIVYKFDSKQSLVEVLEIEHRQGVYK